jgi:hypothetical protein
VFEYVIEELAWYTHNRDIFKSDFLNNASEEHFTPPII